MRRPHKAEIGVAYFRLYPKRYVSLKLMKEFVISNSFFFMPCASNKLHLSGVAIIAFVVTHPFCRRCRSIAPFPLKVLRLSGTPKSPLDFLGSRKSKVTSEYSCHTATMEQVDFALTSYAFGYPLRVQFVQSALFSVHPKEKSCSKLICYSPFYLIP